MSTVVLGATGKTGRRVVERLEARGVPVRAGSRSAAPPFDWEDPATWVPALHGASAVYISYFPDLAVPGAAEAVAEVARLAVAAGARRIVLLSGRGEEEAQHAERAVFEVFPDATVVRCSWFAQNFSEGYLLDGVLAGEVALPVGDVPEPFVDVDDVADVAVAALTGDGHAGQVYELTGPRLLTFAQAVEEIAEESGRPVRFAGVTMPAFVEEMAAAGVPDDVVQLLEYLFTEVLDGRNAAVADGVERALGRPARDFRDFARRAAVSLR
jgi:uncharacterized protein YbjT (DUF2867 family)